VHQFLCLILRYVSLLRSESLVRGKLTEEASRHTSINTARRRKEKGAAGRARMFVRVACRARGAPQVSRLSVGAPVRLPQVSRRAAGTAAPGLPDSAEIAIDDFLKTDLRAARVVSAEPVAGADKLVRLELDCGPIIGKRTVLSGLVPQGEKEKTSARAEKVCEDVLGSMVVLVANLAPRKMRFGVSQGMVLAAVDTDGVPRVVRPHENVALGERIY
jgi:methionyl-tRNA synthetase